MGNIKIAFVGDIAFFSKLTQETINSFNVKEYEDLLKSDICMGNFEFPFSNLREKYFMTSYEDYISPLSSLEILRKFKFTALSLANNHILDWGVEGINTTQSMLSDLNIKTFGAGTNESNSRKPLILTVKSIKLGFLSYCKKGEYSSRGDSPGSAQIVKENILNDIEQLRRKVDHIFIILHWGVEFSDYPYPDDIILAHDIINAGASCIIGHHPHVVQGLEIYNGKPIFYSLGSFIYNPLYERNNDNKKIEERLQSIAIIIQVDHEQLLNWEIIPFKNEKNTLFPIKITKNELSTYSNHFELISKRIGNAGEWFYKNALSNIFPREIKTIMKLSRETKGIFFLKFIKNIKLRHFKMLFGHLFYRVFK
ncbi:MAG: CapA family protein [Melioribacteraceae bacterium]|nr:CapA family protein [Melioribacteraceae bacterium]